jgi:hypothetical protein
MINASSAHSCLGGTLTCDMEDSLCCPLVIYGVVQHAILRKPVRVNLIVIHKRKGLS